MDEELKTIKNIVEEIMEDNVECRNNDNLLVIKTLNAMGHAIFANKEELKKMPSFESITRCRRDIQNRDGKLQATKTVQALRDIEEKRFRRINEE